MLDEIKKDTNIETFEMEVSENELFTLVYNNTLLTDEFIPTVTDIKFDVQRNKWVIIGNF